MGDLKSTVFRFPCGMNWGMNALMAFPDSYKRGRPYRRGCGKHPSKNTAPIKERGLFQIFCVFFVNFTMIYIVIESFTIARLQTSPAVEAQRRLSHVLQNGG